SGSGPSGGRSSVWSGTIILPIPAAGAALASSGTGSREAALAARSRREVLLRDLRRRGVRGGVIPQHRAMVGLPWTGARLITSVGLGLGGLALLLGGLRPVTALWCRLFAWIHPRLGLPGAIELRRVDLFGLLNFSLPTP